MTIGKRIKWLRKRQEWTQYTLAEKLDLTIDMIRSLEGDRRLPSVESLIKMTDLFFVSSDFILGIRTDYIDFWTGEMRSYKEDKPNEK